MNRKTVHLAAIILLAACASFPPNDIGGFSGYTFGSGYDFILEDMRSEGYKPVELNERAQWYRGKLEGYQTEIAYLFKNELLVSGLWTFQDTSPISFQSIEELLLRTYSNLIARTTENGITSHEHHGPDARILHVLDVGDSKHTVHYYFTDPVTNQAAHR